MRSHWIWSLYSYNGREKNNYKKNPREEEDDDFKFCEKIQWVYEKQKIKGNQISIQRRKKKIPP